MKLDKPSDWSQNPGDKWLPTLSFMKIGYQAYGGGPATAVYIDDVAFSASKIGCL
jgi:hypothetical protein